LAGLERLADFEMRVGSWYWVRPERRATMEVEKIRNLSDEELTLEGRKAAEQLFRLRFQMKLGQTEGAKKLRDLKKDIARINTIERERELGIHTVVAPKHHHAHGAGEGEETQAAAARQGKKKAAKPAKKRSAKKSASSRKGSGRSASSRKTAARPSANKKKAARSSSVKKG
jgi:large subunit ribosomal protein L29